jgi:hypothetical protein
MVELSATPVERDEVNVMFIRTGDDVGEMRAAWERLEELVGTCGRKFYGAFYPSTKEHPDTAVLCTEWGRVDIAPKRSALGNVRPAD